MNTKRWSSFRSVALVLALLCLGGTAIGEALPAGPTSGSRLVQGDVSLGAQAYQTMTFTPSEDSYAARQQARFAVDGTNHDGENLLVQSTVDGFTQSYLKFDLSTFPAQQRVVTATLRLYKTAGPEAAYPLDVYRIEEDWQEGTLGTSEAATPWLWLGDKLNTRMVAATNDMWVEINVTGEVNRILHGDGTPEGYVNLGLGTEQVIYTWGAPAMTFGDSEGAAARRPQMVVIYDPSSPWADAGADQEPGSWTLGNVINLDGSGSRDPSQAAEELVYSWQFLRIPGESELKGTDISPNGVAGASRPTFTPDALGRYTIRLTVRNHVGLIDTDTVYITVWRALPDHPRIWLTSERLAALRQRAASSTPEWRRLLGVLDSYMGTAYPDLWGAQSFIMAYGLAYQVLRDTEPTAANAYADKAIELMNYMADRDVSISADSWLYFGEAASALAVGYDWCYDRLTAAERIKIIGQLNDWVDEAFAMPPDIDPWAYYAVEHRPEVNRYYAHLYGRAIVGLATLEDNEPRAQEYVDIVSQQNIKEIVPFLQLYGEGGDWSEGWNYTEPTMRHLFLAYEAARSVYGEDPYRDTPFPIGLLQFMVHATLPDLSHGYPEGDLWESTASVGDGHRGMMLLLVNEFADSTWGKYGQQWLETTITSPDSNTVPGRMSSQENFFQDFLWGNPDLPSRSFDDLTPTHYASGGGTVLARADWGDDSTWVSFHSGGFPTDHLHRAHNHFNIWRGEWLAYDANLGASYAYNAQPWFHNVVVVNGADQATSNVGRVLRFQDTGTCVYALGNAAPAMWYMDWNIGQPVRVASHYTRSFLYWRPDILVVLDRLTASQASYSKEWLLNVPAQPSIDGNQITVTGPQGKGKLFCRTLWPQGANTTSVPLASLAPEFDLQGWQVRVTPPTVQADDIFLHVLHVTGPGATSMADTALIQSSQGNMIGAHQRAGAGNTLTLFSADAGAQPPAGNIVYSFQPTAATEHRLLNLQAGRQYTVTLQTDGGTQTATVRIGQGLRVNRQGVLAFSTTAGGDVLPPPRLAYLPLTLK